MLARFISVATIVAFMCGAASCKPKVQRTENAPDPVNTASADQIALPASTPGMVHAKNGEKLVGICQNTLVQGGESMQCAEHYGDADAFKKICVEGPSKTADGQIYMFSKPVGNCPEGITHGCIYKKGETLASVVWSYNKSEKCMDDAATIPAP